TAPPAVAMRLFPPAPRGLVAGPPFRRAPPPPRLLPSPPLRLGLSPPPLLLTGRSGDQHARRPAIRRAFSFLAAPRRAQISAGSAPDQRQVRTSTNVPAIAAAAAIAGETRWVRPL